MPKNIFLKFFHAHSHHTQIVECCTLYTICILKGLRKNHVQKLRNDLNTIKVASNTTIIIQPQILFYGQ